MIARKAINNAISITTDNGCEFLDPDKIKSIVGCNVYYTRAYASWEKGSIENCNKFVRRWYPKGTDFGKCTNAQMHHLEKVINSIHRKLLDGKTAYEYDTAYNKAA
jgi:IS30 family transposase